MQIFLFAALALQVAQVSASAPDKQPYLAAGPKEVALVFGSESSIWFTQADAAVATFSTPVKVADLPVLPLGRHRGPRVAISRNVVLVTAIGGATAAAGPHAHGLPADGNLLSWRSLDGGKTWGKPVTVNDVPASAREGLHNIAADGQGHVAAVWLDLRASGTRLYGAFSSDDGATWSKNVLLYQSPDGTICQCCHPSVTASGAGSFAVMFRNDLKDHRDMYLIHWQPGQSVSAAQKLGSGSWNLNACPMDGGGLAQRGAQLETAWRRDETVFLDAPGQDETALGQGKDVALALTEKGAYVSWTNGESIYVHQPASPAPLQLSQHGAFSSLVALPDKSVLAAWEENGTIALKKLN
jgi:hypothetical protein